ncbi:MAG: hypothetical protein HUJ75_02985, partial [Parasporobacterium sp.]|nr:hypothetical protein [Parasporobacterium sp.]
MKISENYLKITSPETGTSYGGSQSWFPLLSMKKGGCGIIAAADMLLYLKGVRELSLNDYLRFADRIKKYFLTMGPLGMHGLALASGLNKAFKANKMKYKAKWV